MFLNLLNNFYPCGQPFGRYLHQNYNNGTHGPVTESNKWYFCNPLTHNKTS